MRKILLFCMILMVSVMTSACINNLAIQELNNKAASYLDKGDTEAAICRLKSSLDLDNEIYQTHYNLAVAYNTIGNYEGTLIEAKKVLELKPEFYDSYYIMAIAQENLAYQTLGDLQIGEMPSKESITDFNIKAQEAVDTYNKYVELMPTAQTDKINEKIGELNAKMKEYTDYLDRGIISSPAAENKPVEQENAEVQENQETQEVQP